MSLTIKRKERKKKKKACLHYLLALCSFWDVYQEYISHVSNTLTISFTSILQKDLPSTSACRFIDFYRRIYHFHRYYIYVLASENGLFDSHIEEKEEQNRNFIK